MDKNAVVTSLNLEEVPSDENDSWDDSVAEENATPTGGTNNEENSTQDTPSESHPEKDNELAPGDQPRGKTDGRPPDGFSPLSNPPHESLPSPGKDPKEKMEHERKRHLPEGSGNGSFAAFETPRFPLGSEGARNGPPKFSASVKFYSENKENQSLATSLAAEELRRQNHQLVEALMKTQRSHVMEKKRFNDILLGIDKALSSLPIRLEKIRVRNQRNLSIINSSRFHSGDGNENSAEASCCESSPADDSLTVTSQDSDRYVSSRMKSLLQKMDQLNDLIHTINEGDSPIELLVDSELYAISLLKKEIKTTKQEIEDNRTETETVTSCEGNYNHREYTEDSSSKAKNSFSNELNKASNFKIFENHMMLQEEALNLLTRKIKETEEALLKEVGAKEALQRENEAMAKEIFRLKSTGMEESKGEKFQKTEKLKPNAEATGNNRPYKLIKELKTKLEEKEKSLITWKSKCSRSEATSANKTVLLEAERKKNFELDTIVTNLRTQNKSMSSHLTSLEYINEQLRDQIQILKHQVEILANEKLERGSSSKSAIEHGGSAKGHDEKPKKREKGSESKIQEIKISYEKELKKLGSQLKKHRSKNEMFSETFKELLTIINNFGMGRDIKNIRSPPYNRIRQILHITPSDLELLFSVYAKSSAEKEVERLYKEFQSIVDDEETEFSEKLANWFFDIIMDKMMQWGSGEKNSAFNEA